MRRSTKLFSIFGIDIKIHFSWWFIFALLAWSLSTAFFPQFFPGYTLKTYWMMGILSSLLLFVSVLLHELSHSLVARTQKIKVKSITLFFFGGVAGIDDEDMKPWSEFSMAIAGPLFSLLLAGIFYLINASDINGVLSAITFYLYQINLILAIFNLVPGFPLDGGRAFRALLYLYYKDLRKATKIAATGGRIFGLILIFLGLISLFGGSGGGIWFILIGGFLYFIAGMSYDQLIVKQVLDQVLVKTIMENPKKIPAKMKISGFVKKHQNNNVEEFVLSNGKILDINAVQNLPVKLQKVTNVEQLAIEVKGIISPQDTLFKAFRVFSEAKIGLLPVVEKAVKNKRSKRVVGYVRRSAVLHNLTWDLKFGGKKHLARRMKNIH